MGFPETLTFDRWTPDRGRGLVRRMLPVDAHMSRVSPASCQPEHARLLAGLAGWPPLRPQGLT